ncbi:hypothetical protein BPAE_0214g00140 [Botrytis paeoniae]|uniref:Uncharacterized protein n=1 Tax=Botrytis paeoniae TaxID=278948 RepID=A0A4Z1FFX6_9HELO|nr:hypothetical protein BPAE_0214g00140 [Botrytis paeoniae]
MFTWVRTLVLDRKPWDGGIIHETELYEGSDKDEEEEAYFEGADMSMVTSTAADDGNDGDDESSSEDSDNDFEDSWPHSVSPRRYYKRLELTSKQLQSDWTLARWEWWKPIWEEFFIERDQLPAFDDVTFPEEELLDNPDWTVTRVQLLSFQEMGCPISDYNRHCLYPEEEFVCTCESNDDFELLKESDEENNNFNAEDDL